MIEDRDVVPTRSRLRELEAERRVVTEGRQFLDQKRMLLAAEILRRLERYEAARRAIDEAERRAVRTLADALGRHGLEGTLCQPAPPVADAQVEVAADAFLGVPVVASRLVVSGGAPPPASQPSPEARRCREAYRALLERYAALAAEASSLERLRREYQRAERRTRALEDVLEPELEGTIGRMREELEAQDQEEAIRARLHR